MTKSTEDQIRELLARGVNTSEIGRMLAGSDGRRPETIARQALRIRNKILKESIQTREREKFAIRENSTLEEIPEGETRVLCISDLHSPAIIDGALEHCLELYSRWKCNAVVVLGDVFDLHRLGRWDHDPETPSISDELDEGVKQLEGFYYHFPNAKVTIGNHDDRTYKTMFKAGLPERCRPGFGTLYESPSGWHYDDRHVIDGVTYTHGSNMCAGPVAQAARRANTLCGPLVQAHHHFGAGVQYATPRDYSRPIFGASMGCLCDGQHRYFGYASGRDKDPSIGAGVVIAGAEAHFEPLFRGYTQGVEIGG